PGGAQVRVGRVGHEGRAVANFAAGPPQPVWRLPRPPSVRRRRDDNSVLPGRWVVGLQVSAAHPLGRGGRAPAETLSWFRQPAVLRVVTIPPPPLQGRHRLSGPTRYVLGSALRARRGRQPSSAEGEDGRRRRRHVTFAERRNRAGQFRPAPPPRSL